MTGARSYHTGRAAEEIAARDYLARGYSLREERWRGQGGEVDLIFEHDGALIFVEVKASDNFANAALHISPRQMERIYAAASEYLASMPDGQSTEVRFDAAFVDGQGRLEILEGAFGI